MEMDSRCARHVVAALTGAVLSLAATAASAQSGSNGGEAGEQSIEHTVIVGVGGAAELELADGEVHPGANVMIEWDAIENWLELEADASILSVDRGKEVPIALTFKKPFRLTRWAEVMVGLGPELVYVSTPSTTGTFFGGQLVVDSMFWPTQRFGLWIEPSYDLIARDGLSQGMGVTGGLLMGW